MNRRKFLTAGAAGTLAAALPWHSWATTGKFPSKSVRWIVPAAPRGSADKLARSIAQKLDARWGERVIVENAAGGAGKVAALQALRGGKDGHTVFHASETLALNAAKPDGLPFRPVDDFRGVVRAIVSPMLFLVRPGLGVSNFADYVELIKSRPGKVTVALPAGKGSLQHLALALLTQKLGVSVTPVPYPGGGPAMLDALGGHVDSMVITLAAATENVRAGNLIGLAVTTPYRSKALPDIPTLQELGVKDYAVEGWQAMFVPSGTQTEVVNRLHDDIAQVLTDPAVIRPLETQGFEIALQKPDELDRFLREEGLKYRLIADQAGIALQ